jgi:ankyrin repeat protein
LNAAARRGEPNAIERLRGRVPRLVGASDAAVAARATESDARVCLAREYGFRTWSELAEATDRARHAGQRETVELLVDRGAPLDARDSLRDATPLDWASHNRPDDEELHALLRTR